MRDSDAYSGRLPELYPSHICLVTPSNVIKPTIGCIDNDDLGRLSKAPSLADNVSQSFAEAILIFADDDNRDHRWNTSEEPSVYTRS